MPHIIVDDEQAELIAKSANPLEIRDRQGRYLGYVAHGFSDEDFALAKKRLASDEPRLTTRQVLDHLRSLERP
jgi:hypothetical protein